MYNWVKFSNGAAACYVGDHDKLMTEWKARGLPVVTYGWNLEYMDAKSSENRRAYTELQEMHRKEAIAQYIAEKWPQQDVEVVEILSLPYPASPQFGGPKQPSFCYTPGECCGKSSCPKRYSCVD